MLRGPFKALNGGVEFVDLPGMGDADDDLSSMASEFLQEQQGKGYDHIILVNDVSGMAASKLFLDTLKDLVRMFPANFADMVTIVGMNKERVRNESMPPWVRQDRILAMVESMMSRDN